MGPPPPVQFENALEEAVYSRQQAAARSPSPGKGTLDISVTCVGPEIDLTMIRAKEGVKCE